MRRSRFRSFNSRIRRSSFIYGSGMRSGMRFRGRYGRSSVPLKGPAAVIVLVCMILFFVFFILNFVFAIFLPDFLFDIGIWFFFVPLFAMAVIFITTIVATISSALKGQVPGMAGMQQGFGAASILDFATQLGFPVTRLPNNDPSTAQAVIQSPTTVILVKLLHMGQPFQNGMVQDLSKGLVTYQAKEAWLIQTPPTFVENDLNFARFYNVRLYRVEEAVQALQALKPVTPTPAQGQ